MVKIEEMNVYDCMISTERDRYVRLYLSDDTIIEGCPDDILRGITYEDAGKIVDSMGFDFERKLIAFKTK